MVVVWLHILGPYLCMCAALDYFNNCNFSKHVLVCSLMMV